MKRGKRSSLDSHENYDVTSLVETINKLATRIDTLDHRLENGNFRLCDRSCCHEHSKGVSNSVSCINMPKLAGDCDPSEIKPANHRTHEKNKGPVDMEPRKTKSDSKILESYEFLPTEEQHGSEKQKLHALNIDKLAGKPQNDGEKQPASNMNLDNVPKRLDIREIRNIKDSFGAGNSFDQFIRIDSSGLKSTKTDPQEDNRQKRIKDDFKIKISAQVNVEETDDKPNKEGNLMKTVRSGDKNRNKHGGCTRSEPIVSGNVKTLAQTHASSMVPTHLPIEYWDSVCHETYDKALKIQTSRSIGYDTIICLDTSASVAEYWGDILDFLRNLINEIEAVQPIEGGLMEHIALVTYGHETSALQHFTTNYQELLTQIRTMYPEGSTPMYWAVDLCKAILLGSAYAPRLRGFRFAPRLLLITDGRPTYRLLTGGTDEPVKCDEDQEKEDIARQLIFISMLIPLLRVYAVAVGSNCDKEFLTAITKACGGKVKTLSDWSSMAQYGKKMELASKYFGLASVSQDLLVNVLRERSGLPQEDIEFVTTEVKNQLEYQDNEGTISDEEEVQGTYQLPPVGSRVRRGPHWNRNDEDNGGPGTIIAYSKGKAFSGWIIVEWDQPKKYSRWRFKYRYGAENAYDVQIQAHEEPRVMEHSFVRKIGCEVIRVNTLESSDGIEEGTVGMVYNVHMGGENAIKVRWQNGKRRIYDNAALLSGVIGLSPRSRPYHEFLPFDPSQFLRNLRPSVNQQGRDDSRQQPLRQEALPPSRRQLSTRELQNPSALHNEGNDRDFTGEREPLTIENVESGGMPFVDDMNIRNQIRTRMEERRNKETLYGTKNSSYSKTRYDQKEVTKSDTQAAPNGNKKLPRMKKRNKNADV